MPRESYSIEELRGGLEQLAQFGTPPSGVAEWFDVGTDAFVRYADSELFAAFIRRGGATCKIFEGPYGSGKTHALRLLEAAALRHDMAVAKIELSGAQHLEDWHLITKALLQNLQLQTPDGTVQSLPEICLEVARRQLHSIPPMQDLPHRGFARAIWLLATNSLREAAARDAVTRYLQGDRIRVSDLRRFGVTGVKQALSARNAELVAKTVLSALLRMGVGGTVILFDENEHTFQFRGGEPPRKVRVAANVLRRVIDGTSTGSLRGSLVAFAVLPGFIETCGLAYPALGQRLARGWTSDRVGWRSPILPVDTLGRADTPERFAELFAERTAYLLAQITGRETADYEPSLLIEGRDAARSEAGLGYRRQVVKRVAARALTYLN